MNFQEFLIQRFKQEVQKLPIYIGRCPDCNGFAASDVIVSESRMAATFKLWTAYGLTVERFEDKAAWQAELDRVGWCKATQQPVQLELLGETV